MYSFSCVCPVKQGCPGESGSSGSWIVHASPLLASPWQDFGPGVNEVGWLVGFQCRVDVQPVLQPPREAHLCRETLCME